MEIKFYKYQGTGNDFVLIDNRDLAISLTTSQIKQLCERRFGIGADGLMLLQNKEGYDFHMVYYNSDGNQSTMCGNGGRCIVKFAHSLGVVSDKTNFLAIDGPHDAVVLGNGDVSLKMQDVATIEQNKDFCYLNTGSPHYVRFVKGIADYNVCEEGKVVRNNDRFKKEGTNVNFVEQQNENTIFVRTYERGVEDETFSCGTGVVAAVLASNLLDITKKQNETKVKTLGGDLTVRFEKNGNDSYFNVWLEGNAEFVFNGTVNV